MDFLYLGVVIAFFALTLGLLSLCERLAGKREGERP